ncbi:MAG: hypothetical protein C0597_11490 [Marinilabiliales bacterium]|nr:MAG: hypothetical protein C0597_11490 [Marinilabiliales bacterium]
MKTEYFIRIKFVVILLIISNISIAQIDTIESTRQFKVFKYPNGTIASQGYLENNKPIGFWKSYYITGIKKSEGVWKANKLDSIWIFYDQVGDTTEKISYYLGKRNGYQYKYFRNEENKNIINSKDLYINGQRNGDSYYYYNNGKIKKSIPYLNDKRHGLGFDYDSLGNIITISRYRKGEIIVQENINRYDKKGEKDGVWKEFYLNGNIREEKNYTNGRLNGYYKRYNNEGGLVNSIKYKNGEVDFTSKDFESNVEIKEEYNNQGNLVFQGSFKKEIPVGVHRNFNNEGKVIKSKTIDINGKLLSEGIVLPNGWEEGNWVFYHENNVKRAVGKFTMGKKTGTWTYYYPNGKVQQTGSYTTDKLTGIWRWYYETGELLKEEYYIYGKLDGESVEYSVLGEIIAKGNYIENNKEGIWSYVVGDQKYSGRYVMGFRDGIWESYYLEEETLSFKGKYLQGNPEGKHEYFYPDGTLKEEQFYNEGKKIRSWSKYNEKGELIIVVQYKEGIPYKINGEKVELKQNEN